jgi:hypothetical protein
VSIRRTKALDLSGIAARRPTSRRTAAIASIAGATLALSGCTAPDDGVKYVVPDGAERPQYNSREDCIADVTEQIRQLEAQGEDIVDDPEDLCESTAGYHGAYVHPWIGPLIFLGARWNSPRVAAWSTVGNGGFAAPGSKLQSDVVQRAPAGSKVGERAPLKGGFGTSGKGGFGTSSGG